MLADLSLFCSRRSPDWGPCYQCLSKSIERRRWWRGACWGRPTATHRDRQLLSQPASCCHHILNTSTLPIDSIDHISQVGGFWHQLILVKANSDLTYSCKWPHEHVKKWASRTKLAPAACGCVGAAPVFCVCHSDICYGGNQGPRASRVLTLNADYLRALGQYVMLHSAKVSVGGRPARGCVVKAISEYMHDIITCCEDLDTCKVAPKWVKNTVKWINHKWTKTEKSSIITESHSAVDIARARIIWSPDPASTCCHVINQAPRRGTIAAIVCSHLPSRVIKSRKLPIWSIEMQWRIFGGRLESANNRPVFAIFACFVTANIIRVLAPGPDYHHWGRSRQ